MAKAVSQSPERYTFQNKRYLDRITVDPSDTEAKDILDVYMSLAARERDKLSDPEWQKDNLEYDLRSTDWILQKARNSEGYAQNLYAALCNNEFQKNDTWPVLKDQRWSCSWRHAGGIVADMLEKGDYIDWYCSGIINTSMEDDFKELTEEQQEQHLYRINQYVSESVVTEEIKQDLLTLGWIVIDES